MAAGKYERWLSDEGGALLTGWARDGLSFDQIAKKMGCSSSTLRVWRREYPSIAKAIERGREVCDYQAENALFKRALGYDWTEVTIETDAHGNERTKTVTRHVPPDVAAIIFYLKNRLNRKWRDKPDDESDQESLKRLRELLGGIPSAF